MDSDSVMQMRELILRLIRSPPLSRKMGFGGEKDKLSFLHCFVLVT